ncbi:MAG: TonB-dependent receptor [Acidobacteriota bacterium]
MKSRMLLVVVLGAAVTLLTTNATLLAQVGTEGSILGVVKDSSGAVVAGAEVTVVNVDTNLTKMATTDSQGNFEILALPRGFYSVTASFTGFKTWALARTELTLGEKKRLSPVLEVGEVTEKITVEAQGELIQTEKGSVESTIGAKQIVELPLNGRSPVELVRLVPGMRYLGQGGPERGFTVQGNGSRDDGVEFQMDGLNANSGMDEKGFGIPNVDTIAEFNVETANFSAEHGRNPLQVLAATKSGTNGFHGTLWEFHRNHKMDAKNTFATRKPKLIRNQFGYSLGGPIVKDKTFFFSSYEGTRIRQETIYNSVTIRPEMLNGDFSALLPPAPGQPGKYLRDPGKTGPCGAADQSACFPGNQIPADRIANSAKFFFPYILTPNSGPDRFRAVASQPSDTDEFTVRIDQQLTNKQRIYGRYVINDFLAVFPQYRPDITQENGTKQQNLGVNYTYSMTPTTLFTLGANYLRSLNLFTTDVAGKENLTEQAGIQGFPTPGRDELIGLPSVSFTGYTGFGAPWGTPGRLWFESWGGKASVNLIRGAHSLNIGYEFNDRTTYGRHGSCCSRGVFGFNGQYTGDGFADYLLGLIQNSSRNYPLQTFGMANAPYSALYVQDFWKISPNVTLNLGLRWDYWHQRAAVRGNHASFDVNLGKAIAGEDKNGRVDLTSQPVAAALAAATKDIWVPASQAGYPRGLFEANGFLAPRVGIAWRPGGSNSLVVRGGYGIFTSQIRGNTIASALIGPPYWTFETQGWSAAQLQRWETAWPSDPTGFVAPSVTAPVIGLDENKVQQYNVSVQKELPGGSAITVSYVGNNLYDGITQNNRNEVPPGLYPNLQAARPWPAFGSVNLYDNTGESWYNSMQIKWEKRFSDGFSYMLSYAFAKQLDNNGGEGLWDTPTPFAPEGYNKGRASLDRTHILALNAVYELPFGRNRRFMPNVHPVANAILGGWQISGIYNFTSGQPLSFIVPGATLGNGWNTRANISGNLEVSNPSAERWFNRDVLSAPAPRTYGSSGLNIFDGPGSHIFDTSLSKNFYFMEGKYVQFRWEMFNMPNHVNLNNPTTTIGLSNTGVITSAGPARSMQLGLKVVF